MSRQTAADCPMKGWAAGLLITGALLPARETFNAKHIGEVQDGGSVWPHVVSLSMKLYSFLPSAPGATARPGQQINELTIVIL